MTKGSEKVTRYKHRQMAKGLCSTGCKRPLHTKWLCKICQETRNEKYDSMPARRKLMEQGLCSNSCGNKVGRAKWFCDNCLDKLKKYSSAHYYRDHEASKKRHIAYNHHRRFGGIRPQVVDRDSNTCQVCFRPVKIVVHHINENPKDNRIDNLICLCRICHCVVERMNANKPNLLMLFPWFNPNKSK